MAEMAEDGYPRILPAYDDGIFKSIFTRNESKYYLADIISSFIGTTVTGVTINSNEVPIKHKDAKRSVFDVSCTAADGKSQFVVEMQADPMKYDSAGNEHLNIRHRSIYYLTSLHANLSGRGAMYSNFAKSYQITVCNYSPFRESHRLLEEFLMRNSRGVILADAIRAIFVDLSLIGEIIKKNPLDMTAAEKWSVFIAKANDPEYQKLIGDIIKSKEEIAMAQEVLASISTDADERARYISQRMLEQDMEHERVYWREISREEGIEEGLREGREAGIKEGRESGIKEGRIEVARKMLDKGMDTGSISQLVELPEEEIEKLRI